MNVPQIKEAYQKLEADLLDAGAELVDIVEAVSQHHAEISSKAQNTLAVHTPGTPEPEAPRGDESLGPETPTVPADQDGKPTEYQL